MSQTADRQHLAAALQVYDDLTTDNVSAGGQE